MGKPPVDPKVQANAIRAVNAAESNIANAQGEINVLLNAEAGIKTARSACSGKIDSLEICKNKISSEISNITKEKISDNDVAIDLKKQVNIEKEYMKSVISDGKSLLAYLDNQVVLIENEKGLWEQEKSRAQATINGLLQYLPD
jgi:hypothetical protein